ncbi:S8 family peptidase [Paenibacillus silvae]|uniref:S8 family peptidase n=1 Tax=Paenibacillus silvae TaxID=1325358 RepID=UPI002004E58F|nr:S8 family peptidase [Paenibacillus silvae]MCK6075359.1 S8 family peptidase [Paenibacillus silvae]MCK6149746.1 S8 family peptidase [Paenibacillus silvae]MCK6268044.1 S8 family peptidase [Paenibacillus silvae]
MKIPDSSKDKLSPHAIKQLDDLRSEDQIVTVLIKKEKVIGISALDSEFEEAGAKVIDRFEKIDTDVVQIQASKLKELLKNPAVKSVAMEKTYHQLLDVATKVISGTSSPQLNTNLSGEGVTIAIVDSGIYPHPDLTTPENRIVGFYDVFAGKEVAPFDDGGHGTHCAGCVASNGRSSDKRYSGLAYNSKLVGVRVFEGRTTSTTTIIKGVDWCIENKDKYGIKIMSLSLGGEADLSPEFDPLCEILRKAHNEGITVFVAAGNSGPFPKSIESPGIEPEVITVGATNDQNTIDKPDDVIANFSSRGPSKFGHKKPDIVAPGSSIISLRAPNSEYDQSHPERRVGDDYCWMSGTSMATPIVAGLAALLYEAKPEATPEEIKEALLNGANDIFDDIDSAGRGYSSLEGALEFLKTPISI